MRDINRSTRGNMRAKHREVVTSLTSEIASLRIVNNELTSQLEAQESEWTSFKEGMEKTKKDFMNLKQQWSVFDPPMLTKALFDLLERYVEKCLELLTEEDRFIQEDWRFRDFSSLDLDAQTADELVDRYGSSEAVLLHWCREMSRQAQTAARKTLTDHHFEFPSDKQSLDLFCKTKTNISDFTDLADGVILIGILAFLKSDDRNMIDVTTMRVLKNPDVDARARAVSGGLKCLAPFSAASLYIQPSDIVDCVPHGLVIRAVFMTGGRCGGGVRYVCVG